MPRAGCFRPRRGLAALILATLLAGMPAARGEVTPPRGISVPPGGKVDARAKALERRQDDLLGEILRLEEEITQKKKMGATLLKALSSARESYERLQKQREALREKGASINRQVEAHWVLLYKMVRWVGPDVLTGAKTLRDLRLRITYLKRFLHETLRKAAELEAKRHSMDAEVSALERGLAGLEARVREVQAPLDALEAEVRDKILELARVREALHSHEEGLRKRLRSGGEAETRPSDEARRNAREGKLGSFPEMKGRIPLPLPGAEARMVTAGPGGGMVLRPSGDKKVRAVHPGVVVFSGTLQGYGQVIIIHHGGRYFTVSAGLAKRFKAKGARVARGEVIGTIDPRTGKGSPGLYFEIREGLRSLDPRQWMEPLALGAGG